MIKRLYNYWLLPEIPEEAKDYRFFFALNGALWACNDLYDAKTSISKMIIPGNGVSYGLSQDGNAWGDKQTYFGQCGTGFAYWYLTGDSPIEIWVSQDIPNQNGETVFRTSDRGFVEYGWSDGGEGDDLSVLQFTVPQGFHIAGKWQCIVSGTDSAVASFEWYRNGRLISTVTGKSDSECIPSADDIGVFKYECVITFENGKSVTAGPMTMTVEAYDPGEDPGGGGDPDPGGNPDPGGDPGGEEGTTQEQLQSAFCKGFATARAYFRGAKVSASASINIAGAIAEPTTKADKLKSSFLQGFVFALIVAADAEAAPVPTAYLYNGVKLPPLPDWDKEEYPYVYIAHRKFTTYDLYIAYNTKEKLSITSSGSGDTDGITNTSFKCNVCNASSLDNYAWDAWRDFVGGAYPPIWSNYDVMSLVDGSVYLAASEPVPVYGEQVPDGVLISSDGYILTDNNGVYLIAKEDS